VAAGHSSFRKPDKHLVLSAVEHGGLPQPGHRSAGAHAPPQGTEPTDLRWHEGYGHGLAHQAEADQAWKSQREKQAGNTAKVLARAQRHTQGGVLSDVPPKPVALLRLRGHQLADQDMGNSLHGAPLGALAPLPAITLLSCPHPSHSRPPWETPGFSGSLCRLSSHLKARVSSDESHHCVKGSGARSESQPKWMLQDTSSCLLFLTQLLPVSPLFSTYVASSLSPNPSPPLQLP